MPTYLTDPCHDPTAFHDLVEAHDCVVVTFGSRHVPAPRFHGARLERALREGCVLGLDRARLLYSGAAPISTSLLEWWPFPFS